MNFELTQEQKSIRAMVRDFSREVLQPKAAELDEQNRFPVEHIGRLAELGLLGIAYPEKDGGVGADSVAEAIAVEEITYACAATGSILTAHYLGIDGLFLAAGDEQRQTYLVPGCSGEKLYAFCLTEPNGGTDVASMKTNARLDGNEYVLNGTKHFITNGAEADVLVVYAKTDTSAGSRGISAFIVEKGTPGLTYGAGDDKMGIRGARTHEVIFDNCRIPKENLVGQEGDGFKIAMTVVDRGRIGIAAMAVGLSQAALDTATAYAKERIAFGKPISEYQGLQWMLAEMAADVETARLYTYYAASLKDREGYRLSKEAAVAKLIASEASHRVVHKAVQIHGGFGYMKEYPVERMYRDQRILEIFEGTSQVQKMVITHHLLK
ncbi:acyl-CoA dehydrogenase family protein [Aneurinibacillus aneurinilyticus]|uniref:Acyl-CoA dehydrogenase n=1 Tax=Aneurinibacillus aneurinilyticus ATCC 12856 TaxID=649747 RepID=U1WFR3_ANEAE|nr:acyl-CoA dehydrogenase family protein [Aneurinibacillus aneurinilyticus]ERI07384.1 putative butyryl-CoA dehydrogenase [Aneurinibacillus aneurinilyticus ATCC 12856]MED0709313.1 acyl-CoA dehydrogenase family protein [Aneurinibacillus aneurinilyticus]MED0721984.1 acyl-CoA dehydrogenase family protein [Aneurinibacillus aneurinilyticus]MED0734722.1 acyl-CoA dehydrogenase family protein [Aneurinibacillus aneurinilyticus]MED0743489.1 acyl-CoA dehydrogenase family protein [Aneurinibacillus aneurini